jgi:hypothetical protein
MAGDVCVRNDQYLSRTYRGFPHDVGQSIQVIEKDAIGSITWQIDGERLATVLKKHAIGEAEEASVVLISEGFKIRDAGLYPFASHSIFAH